jgi:hypothetical protein
MTLSPAPTFHYEKSLKEVKLENWDKTGRGKRLAQVRALSCMEEEQ